MKVSLETVNQVIHLAHSYHVAHDQFMVKYYPERRIHLSEIGKYDDTPEHQKEQESEKKLLDFLFALSYDEIIEIKCLMLFGRGDSGSLESNLDYYKTTHGDEANKPMAIEYITDKLPLDEYLQAALKKI